MRKVLAGAALLALTSTSAVALENEIYGSFNWSLTRFDSDVASGGATVSTVGQGTTSSNNNSRFGLKGSHDRVFYTFEFGMDNNNNSGLGTSRALFVGFKTKIGSFVAGRTESPYRVAQKKADPFYDTSAANFLGGFNPTGASYGLSNLVNGFSDGSIVWHSLPFVKLLGGDLTGTAAIFVQNDGSNEDNGGRDDLDYNAGIDWAGDNFSFGMQYLYVGVGARPTTVPSNISGGAVVDNAFSVNGHYDIEQWRFAGSYENVNLRASATRQYGLLSATYNLSKNTRASVAFGSVDQGGGEGEGVHLGLFHRLERGLTVYVLGSAIGKEDDTDNSTVAAGLKYRFAWRL